jgi:hypothetical protein
MWTRGDRASQGVARMRGNSARRKRKPCRTSTPRSNRKARIHILHASTQRDRCGVCNLGQNRGAWTGHRTTSRRHSWIGWTRPNLI